MAEPRESESAAPTGVPARPATGEVVLPDGGRRAVVVRPEDVWTAPDASPAAREDAVSPPAVRAARRAFFGPIVMVVGLSAALMAVALAVLALGLWLGPRPVG